MNVGIEPLKQSDDVKMFYNIGTEKTWILSALEDKQNKSKMTVCLLTKNCLKEPKKIKLPKYHLILSIVFPLSFIRVSF